MKNPFLDLINKERDEYVTAIPKVEDNILQEDYPTLGTLPDIGPKDPLEEIKKEEVASSVPALSEQKDLLASNNAAKAVEDAKAQLDLPKIDDDAESDKPNDKLSNFESLLQEYRANREGRSKAIEAAAEQDRRTRLLNNLSKAMAQLNTGLASGYANIKVDPIDLGPADAEARARAAQQGKLGELMTEYKLQKAMEPKKVSEKEKIELETAREKLKQLKEKPETKEKELTWEEKQIKKAEIEEKLKDSKLKKEEENKTKASLDSIEEQIQKVRRAKQLLKELVKDSSIADTGPLDQYVTSATSRGQKLKQAFNDLSLDKMTKLFKGMSKAVDSDAERKMFEQSQASLSYYPDVNEEILNNLEKALLSSKQKNQTYLQEVTGKEVQKESSQTPQEVKHKSGKSFNVGQVIRSKDGKKYRIKNENGDLELVK